MHHTGTDYATLASSYQHTKPAVQHMQVPQLSARTLDKTEAPSYKTHCVRCSGCSKLPVSTLDLPAQPLALPAHTRPAKVQLASAADAWCIPGWRASALKLNKVHTVNTRVHAATDGPSGLPGASFHQKGRAPHTCTSTQSCNKQGGCPCLQMYK
jgi:hypothetical protein